MSGTASLLSLWAANQTRVRDALADAGASDDAIPRRHDATPAPLSFAQERLWLLDQSDPGSATYNAPTAMRLAGPFDVYAFERALRDVVARHETLRTVLSVENDAPRQIVCDVPARLVAFEDLSRGSQEEREAAARQRTRDESLTPFDLADGPLVRCRVMRLADDDHVLVVNMHHVVTDGWSATVFFRELSALYAEHCGGPSAALPLLPIQYADFAAWQRDRLHGDAIASELAWWKATIADVPTVLDLPTDRPRAEGRRPSGHRVSATLAREEVERLQGLARADGATLFMVLAAAYQVVLARCSGQDEFLLGAPVAGRSHADLAGLIGFFANTLPLRADVSGDPSFRDLVRRVRATTLAAYAHQEVPFERLVQELRPERTTRFAPLCQVMLTLQDGVGERPSFGGVEVRGWNTGFETAKYDLTLTATTLGDGLRLTMEYATDVFERASAERMLARIERVLRAASRAPDRPISSLPVVLDEESDALARVAGGRSTAPVVLLHDVIAEWARRTPDADAIVHRDERITYHELDRRANRLAHYLRGQGVNLESRVGLLLERSSDLVVAIVAVLKASGTYVPFDPALPSERIAFMAADAGVTFVLARGASRDALSAIATAAPDARVIDIDVIADAVASCEALQPPASHATPDDLAYVIYTSGSTGTPKGTMVPHRAFAGYHDAYLDAPLDGAPETWLHYSSMSWDAMTLELWTPLLRGARCVLYPADAERGVSSDGLGLAIAADGVTHLWMTAALFDAVVDSDVAALAPVRVLLVGGDALSPKHVRRAREALTGTRIVNGYGPSECTVFSTCHVIDAVDGDAISIGAPVGDRRCHVLDARFDLVPMDAAGELCVAGDGVARGYLNRPALTAERFVPDPFSSKPGARLYRTGDRARWRRNGTLSFVGRADGQVKIRGYRVELGEIVALLEARADVAQAAVEVRHDAPGDKRLVAYVVPSGIAQPGGLTRALRDDLRRRLPEYMVPSAFVLLESFPLTVNGKLDRRALPKPGDSSDELDEDSAPRTPAEEILARIWADVLGVERVKRTDDFFAIGGHSLAATRVVARVRAILGVDLPVRALFERTMLADVAELVLRSAAPMHAPPPLERGLAGEGDVPLSFAQQRLWFVSRLSDTPTAYTIPLALRLRGPLDSTALRRATHALVQRHSVLRTTFPTTSGEPRQHIGTEWDAWIEVEARDVGLDDRALVARDHAAAETQRGFDLSTGPLFRARLVSFAPDDHALILVVHHAVADGWSMGVLCRDLAALYAVERGDGVDLPRLPVSYADFSMWQRAWLSGPVVEEQTQFWRDRLSGAPALLALPTDRPRPTVPSFRGGVWSTLVSSDVLARLRAVCAEHGATLHMAILAAYNVLLARYSGEDDIVVGLPVSGRTRPEVDGLIGFFVNTLPLRTDLSGSPSFIELLARVRDGALAAYAHADLPFEQVVTAIHTERALSHAPVFQVTFTMQEASDSLLRFEGVEAEPIPMTLRASKFDFTLGATASAQGLRLTLEYNADVFEDATARRALAHLATLLDAASASPSTAVVALPLIDHVEREAALNQWNPPPAFGAASSDATALIHERFEARAAAEPEAVAVMSELGALEYGELNERANRLAKLLRSHGVGPETRVALCMPRSANLIVAILGILKAGGAYVPLDPAYPTDRLAYVLRDSRAVVLLTDSTVESHLPSDGPPRIAIDAIDIENGDAANLPAEDVRVDGENVAYVIYTSGSTGRPKGVEVTHRNVARLLDRTAHWFGFSERDVWTMFHSFAFDFSVWEMWGALLYGGRLVVIPHTLSRAPAEFRRLLAREHVTVLNQTPSAFRELMRADEAAPDPLSTLRVVIFGGEALDPGMLSPWVERYGLDMPRLVNMYGITETTVHVTYRPLTPVDIVLGARSPIGEPIPDLALYVLDPLGEPSPIGIPGELYVGGEGLARGYQGRAELTATRFVPDPFSGVPGARLYRTGDRVRRLTNGELDYLGRADAQVKIRGFRIEPGEIEAVLQQHPLVQAATVIVREDAPGDRRLAAYVVAPGAHDRLIADLRDLTRSRLPDYMVPSSFMALDALPTTTNGKLDRRALPAPPRVRVEHEAPRTETEATVARIWCAVLGVDAVGLEENFFDAGGNSLLVVQVQSRIASELRRELRIADLFANPTVRSLAGLVSSPVAVEDVAAREGRERAERRRGVRYPRTVQR